MTRLRFSISLLGSIWLTACSGSSEPPTLGSGGTPAAGGVTGNGGSNAGGTVAAGGSQSASGAPSSGGASSGGTSSASMGGTAAGGANTGGTGTSGANSGGTSAGGANTGGANRGGTSAGGTTTGGSSSGGASAGSSSSGGMSTTGGSTTTGYPENTGASCAATAGALKKNPKLPDPFAMHDGTRISTKAQWECRRNEVKKDIEKYEIGTKPEPPTTTATYSGGKLSVVVTTSSGSITLSSTVSGSGSCVVIGMNTNSSLVTGCTQVPFMHDQVVGYNNGSGTQVQSDPFYKVYPSLWGKVGNYSAWSWGISRLIDGIEKVKDQLKVDTTKIAVHGCSYAGKMALFGGAFDERVALTVAQESGGGGITSWRTSQDFTTRTGTNIEKIDNTSYAWFLSSMKSLDPYSLPHDHHELVAMIAPRALIALGNPDYEWLGDESGYKSMMAATEVWKALGVPDRVGFDFTGGHTHCAAAASQTTSVKAFVDKFLKGQTASTTIAIKPVSSKFDLTYTNDWTTPTLQ
ncbi:MAG: hypothetical protein QM756_43180 [Polyangiaceae bacterium]